MEHFQTLFTHPNPCSTQVILLAAHTSSELKELNYDKFCIENVQWIRSMMAMVKITNIKNDFNLNFQKAWCLGHLQSQNESYEFFLLNNLKKN
jgi:hypothetical protein